MSLEERDKAESERPETDSDIQGDTDSDEEVQEDNANGEPANGDTQDPQGDDNMADATPPWEEQTQDEPGDGGESEGQEEPQNSGEEPDEAGDAGEEPDEAGDAGEEPDEAGDSGEKPDEVGETENGLPEGLKIVVQLSQGRATLGVWKPDADPHLETVGWETLEDVLDAIPNTVQQALESWEESPRRPKYVKPKPPRKNQRSGGKPKDEEKKGAEPQPATRQPELQPEQPQTGMARLF